MLAYQNAEDTPKPEILVPKGLPWFLAAGNPYCDWLFCGTEPAMRVLDTWMIRTSSEASILRVQFLLYESEFAGGFIVLDGLELRKARKAENVALLTAVATADRAGLICWLANAYDLFCPIVDDEYYLSKMDLNSPFRGRGFGRALVERYVEEGKNRGYTHYLRDVHANNEFAIRCYRGLGLQISNCTQYRSGKLKYYSMKYERDNT